MNYSIHFGIYDKNLINALIAIIDVFPYGMARNFMIENDGELVYHIINMNEEDIQKEENWVRHGIARKLSKFVKNNPSETYSYTGTFRELPSKFKRYFPSEAVLWKVANENDAFRPWDFEFFSRKRISFSVTNEQLLELRKVILKKKFSMDVGQPKNPIEAARKKEFMRELVYPWKNFLQHLWNVRQVWLATHSAKNENIEPDTNTGLNNELQKISDDFFTEVEELERNYLNV